MTPDPEQMERPRSLEATTSLEKLKSANPGWPDDFAKGFLRGMTDGQIDDKDWRMFQADSIEANGYRAAHREYNSRLLASRRFDRVASPLGSQDAICPEYWECDRCGRIAGPCNDKPQHHLCRERVSV